MKERLISDCLKDWYNGDMLKDKDLIRLYTHMIKTAELLSYLGDRYRLAANEALFTSDKLKGYIDARAIADVNRGRHMVIAGKAYMKELFGVEG